MEAGSGLLLSLQISTCVLGEQCSAALLHPEIRPKQAVCVCVWGECTKYIQSFFLVILFNSEP